MASLGCSGWGLCCRGRSETCSVVLSWRSPWFWGVRGRCAPPSAHRKQPAVNGRTFSFSAPCWFSAAFTCFGQIQLQPETLSIITAINLTQRRFETLDPEKWKTPPPKRKERSMTAQIVPFCRLQGKSCWVLSFFLFFFSVKAGHLNVTFVLSPCSFLPIIWIKMLMKLLNF